jgi:transposase
VKLHTIARRLPEEIWTIFEPLLPPVVCCGEGRPPASNHKCLHGLLYVLITGIGWEYVPPCFPCGRTIKERLKVWLEQDSFRTAWQQLAQRYEQLHGINWDKILLDGSKKPSKKGVPTPAPARSIAPSAAPPSI